MSYKLTIIIVTLLAGISLSGQRSWDLPDDSTSIGIFIYDFLTSEFEGGQIQNYPICGSYDSSGVPLIFTYQPPVDFGWDMFSYPCTEDTVFFATIVWMGTGSISIPEYFFPPDSFPNSDQTPNQATSSYNFEADQWPVEAFPDIELRADSIWRDLSKRTIIDQFAEYPFHVMTYLYTPTVGSTDFNVAKWVVFVYRNPVHETSIDPCRSGNLEQHHLSAMSYPNPFNPVTTIMYELPEHSTVSINIYDIQGRNIQTLVYESKPAGHYEAKWNGTDSHGQQVSTGVYFARLQAGDNAQTIKMVYLR